MNERILVFIICALFITYKDKLIGFFMRPKYKIYKDVKGNDVEIRVNA